MRRLLLTILGLAALAGGRPAAAADTADPAELEALLNQPVYAASKFAEDAAAAPAAVTVLTAGDIRAYGWRTLAEVLNAVRGVHLRYDRFYRYAGVRGLARPGDYSSRLLVLIDGMRVNDNIYDQAGVGHEFPLDVALIERVEFIPGPGSALYGSNAVLGVVNVVVRSGAAALGQTLQVEAGSAGAVAASATVGREWGDARLLVSARAENLPGRTLRFAAYDDPSTNDGVAPDADRESDRKLFLRWVQRELTLTAIVSERSKRIPTGAFGTVFPSRATGAVDRYAFADLQWTHRLATMGELVARIGAAQYDFRGRFDYPAPDGLQQLDQQGRWVDAEARWLLPIGSRQRLVLGVEARANVEQRQRSAYAFTGVDADLNDRSHRFGIYANDEIELLAGLRAVLGVRVDRQLSGRTRASPRVGLVWTAQPGLHVKLLDGRAYREPNAFESVYEDTVLGANPDLNSESLRATELAVDWRAQPNLRLAASAYRLRVRDLIESGFNPVRDRVVFDNRGAVRTSGLEFEADYVAASGWRTRASWSGQSARDLRDGTVLSNAPRSLTKLNATAPLPCAGCRAGLEVQRIGERRTLAGAALPAATLANLTLQIAPPGARLAWSASVYNLFDRRVADPGGPELVQDTIEQDGRSVRLQLAITF